MTEPKEMKHNDRVRLATMNFFRFIVPDVMNTLSPEQKLADDQKYTYDYVKEEAMSGLLAGFQQQDAQKAERKNKFTEELKEMTDAFAEKLASISDEGERAVVEESQGVYIKFVKQAFETEEKARELAGQAMKHDLLQVLPAVDSINHWAKDLGLSTTYETRVQLDTRLSGAQFPTVTVVVTEPETKRSEVWTMDEFEQRFAQLDAQYKQLMDDVERGRELQVPQDSPFRVDPHAQEVIGVASTIWEYLYYILGQDEENSTHNIISNTTGKTIGTVTCSVLPLWEDESNVDDAEDLHDVKMDVFDIQIHVHRCTGIPEQFSSNVIVEMPLPSHFWYAVLPEGFDRSQQLTDEQKRQWGKRGRKLVTTVKPELKDQATLNPEIDSKFILRVLDTSFTVREWFKTGKLQFTVKGEPPKVEVDAERLAQMERDRRQNVQRTRTGGPPRAGGAASAQLAGELKRLEAQLANKDREISMLRQQVSSAGGTPVAAPPADNGRIAQLERELKQAKEQAAKDRAALETERANKPSGACVVS